MSAASSVGPAESVTRALENIFELAHVARPVKIHQQLQRLRRDAASVGLPDSRANFSRKKVGERRNVFLVLAQRRNIDGDHVEAVVEILAERAFFERGAQVAVGGGDQADIHFERFRAAEPLEFALLQDAQQLHLDGGRHVADFVEEQRAFVGQLEFSGLARSGAGEGALLVAE